MPPGPDPSLLAKMRAEGVPDNIANAVATGPAGAVHRLNDADLNAALRRWFKDYRQEKEAHMSIMQLANIELCAAELRRRFESGAKGKP